MLSMAKKALLVVDIQNFFIDERTADLPRKIKQRIESEKYDELIFTKFINTLDSNFFLNGWKHCMEPPETDIHPELASYANDSAVFEKHGFSAFRAEGLLEYLKRKGIKEIHICGTDTDACVLASAYDAFEFGYDVKVLEDLCASRNGKEFHDMGLKIMRRNLEFKETNKKP
jgi:nicotinamidase-related amidase